MSPQDKDKRHLRVVRSASSGNSLQEENIPTRVTPGTTSAGGAPDWDYPKRGAEKSKKSDDMTEPRDTYSRKTIETMFELHQEKNSRQLDKFFAEICSALGEIKNEVQGLRLEISTVEDRISSKINKHEAVLATHMSWVIGVVGALTVTIIGGLVISYFQDPYKDKANSQQVTKHPAIEQAIKQGKPDSHK